MVSPASPMPKETSTQQSRFGSKWWKKSLGSTRERPVLADVYLEKGDYQQALPHLEKWAATDPQNDEVQNKLKLAADKTRAGAKKNGP